MRPLVLLGVLAVLSIPLLGQDENPVSAWATFIGGEGADSGRNAAMDADGNMYLVGNTLSRNLHPAIFDPRSRQLDFVLQIRATGQIGWAVPLGTGPSVRDVAVAPDGTVYVLSEARIIIFDRNGSRLAEATIPKPADKRVYTSFELAADPRGGAMAAVRFDFSGPPMLPPN